MTISFKHSWSNFINKASNESFYSNSLLGVLNDRSSPLMIFMICSIINGLDNSKIGMKKLNSKKYFLNFPLLLLVSYIPLYFMMPY